MSGLLAADKIMQIARYEYTTNQFGEQAPIGEGTTLNIPCYTYHKRKLATVSADSNEGRVSEIDALYAVVSAAQPGIPKVQEVSKILDRNGNIVYPSHRVVSVVARGGSLGVRPYYVVELERIE